MKKTFILLFIYIFTNSTFSQNNQSSNLFDYFEAVWTSKAIFFNYEENKTKKISNQYGEHPFDIASDNIFELFVSIDDVNVNKQKKIKEKFVSLNKGIDNLNSHWFIKRTALPSLEKSSHIFPAISIWFHSDNKPNINSLNFVQNEFDLFSENDWRKKIQFKGYYESGKLMYEYIGFKDEQSEKTGEFQSYYQNGKIMSKGKILRGNKWGIWTYFLPNGKVYKEGRYGYLPSDEQIDKIGLWTVNNGELVKLFNEDIASLKSAFPNLNPSLFLNFEGISSRISKYEAISRTDIIGNGKIYYPFLDIEPEKVFKCDDRNMNECKNDSFYNFFDDNGNIVYSASENKDITNTYHENGNLKKREIKDWNTFNSKIEIFYDDNKIKSSGNAIYILRFSNWFPAKNGIWVNYYNNGSIKSEIVYDKNKPRSSKNYNKKGILTHLGNFVYSKKESQYVQDGKWTYFFENGKIESVKLYKGGIYKGYWEQYLEDGTKILSEGNGEVRTFHENGSIKMKSEHKNGSRDGITTWYYDNGQIEQSAYYKYDEISKPFGLRWNIISSFHKDGTKRDKGTLKNGKGTWISYDKNGNQSKITKYRKGMQIK